MIESILRDHHAPLIRSTPVLAAITGVSVSAVVRWIRGESTPTPLNQVILRDWSIEAMTQIKRQSRIH
jgi:DNA-binding transcriptional regulator YiaG